MVKGQVGQVVDAPPHGDVGVGRAVDLVAHGLVGAEQRKIGDGDHAAARVAVRFAKGIKLLQVDVVDVGFFAQFAKRGIFQVFVDLDKAAGQGPFARQRADVCGE